MAADLELRLPWLPGEPLRLDGLVIRRGQANVLRFDDGLALAVEVVDPGEVDSPEQLLARTGQMATPGTLTLVAGPVPGRWRPRLRAAGQSWLDRSGVTHIDWPRLRVSTTRAALTRPRRQRASLPLQQGRAVVAQELVVRALEGAGARTLRSVAKGAGGHVSTASRLVSQLEEHGFVVKERHGREILIAVPDPRALADVLARRTSWRATPRLWGYSYGHTAARAAAEVAARAAGSAVVTGRVAALFHGVREPRTRRRSVGSRCASPRGGQG